MPYGVGKVALVKMIYTMMPTVIIRQQRARFRRLHRKHVAEYMSQLDSELDRTAERDSYRFLRKVKSRRKNTSENLGSGIKFNGVTVRDRKQITDNW